MNKRGIVLGASSGVGQAVTEGLRDQGATVYALSRRGTSVPSGAGAVTGLRCDVTNYTVVTDCFRAIAAEGDISFVVNCAGVGFYAPLGRDFSTYWQKILNTNILGLTHVLSCLQEPGMTTGDYIHVGSLAAYRPSRTVGNLVYSASKAAALPLLKAFREELRSKGGKTRVAQVNPGFIEETDFGRNYFISDPASAQDIYGHFKGLSAREVADVILMLLNLPENVEISEVVLRPAGQPD